MKDARQKAEVEAAQLWCLPEHENKEMDAEFCKSIADALESKIKEIETLREAAGNLRETIKESFPWLMDVQESGIRYVCLGAKGQRIQFEEALEEFDSL